MHSSCYTLPILWLFNVRHVFTLVFPQHPACVDPLGMESRKITDDQLFAPINAYQYGFGVRHIRLNGVKAYCTPSGGVGGFDKEVYITIDLRDEFTVTALAFQGDRDSPYSDKIKLTYSRDGEKFNDSNDTIMLSVDGKKGDEIEHVPIQPILASKLKIQLENTMTHKCVRIEIYGCKEKSSNKSYQECDMKDEAILQKNYPDMNFSQTDSSMEETKYNVEHLIYSKPYAWCLSSRQTPSYKHWATIDMRAEYLIYGIEVKGIKQNDNIYGHITDSFKLKYSVDGREKTLFERRELDTSKYKLMRPLRVPLLARYIYLGMGKSRDQMNCLKVELFGCQVTSLFGDRPVVIPAKSTDAKVAGSGKISDIFLGLILLLVLTLIAVVTMGVLLVKRKRNKAIPKRRGPLPEIPVYSNLNQNDFMVDEEEERNSSVVNGHVFRSDQ